MDKIPEKVLEAVKEAATEGKLTCADARALAQKLGVEILLIGKAADEVKVRIKSCQLGCF